MAEAVIAVRGGPTSKSRCAAALPPGDRSLLTQLMLQDMIAAATRTASLTRIWVVTPTESLAIFARRHGARVIEQTSQGLNAAFALALDVIGQTAPYAPVALLPGDLPLLRPDDVEAAVALTQSAEVVLSPACSDGGTGAIVLRAGVRLPLAYGPDSFARHRREAVAAGLSSSLFEAASLGRDIDRPEDLAFLLENPRDTAAGAFLRSRMRTRSVGGTGIWDLQGAL